LSFTDNQTLATAGLLSAAGSLSLTTTGAGSNLTLNGDVTTAPLQTVTLVSAGGLSQAGGAITAATLTGSSVGNASFDQANLLSKLGEFSTTADGIFTLTNNQALKISGPLNTGGDLRIRVNTGDLIVAGNVTAGAGNKNAALVATTGNASEQDDPVVTATGLIIDAPAGNVSFGISGGTVFPASANAVGTLAGAAGGSFAFLNSSALTVGTVPSVVDVASQSGITASSTTAGDVLVQTNNVGQSLTLAGNITAGGRAIFDTAGAFVQTGNVTVTAPVLAIDTTGSGVNTLLGFITSPSVSPSVISNLPPAGKTSNPVQFANLSAPNSVVLLFADQGAVTGTMQVAQLGLSGLGSNANLQGSINGVTGPDAALRGLRNPGPEAAYLFNDCIIAAGSCAAPMEMATPGMIMQQPGVTPAPEVTQQPVVMVSPVVTAAPVIPIEFLVTQPQTAGELEILTVLPNLSAQIVLITPEVVRGVRQSEDPDAPVINVFDEERLCDETAQSSQPARERCQERR
jgi:hypothetical protein